MATINRQQAAGRQAKKGERTNGRRGERKFGNMQHATSSRQASQEGRRGERKKESTRDKQKLIYSSTNKHLQSRSFAFNHRLRYSGGKKV
ncbi:MAG: hypothetical protein LBL13_02220 [Bacteroidales bacterium]|nr:hypothetical protein [Bacteroidales bacterium]